MNDKKYKVLGIINLSLSGLFSLFHLQLLLFVFPKIYSLSRTVDIEMPPVTIQESVISMLIFVGIGYLAVRLLQAQTQKLFTINIITLIFLVFQFMYFISSYFTAVLTR